MIPSNRTYLQTIPVNYFCYTDNYQITSSPFFSNDLTNNDFIDHVFTTLAVHVCLNSFSAMFIFAIYLFLYPLFKNITNSKNYKYTS